MKGLIVTLFFAVQALAGVASAGAPIRDLRVILQDVEISNFFKANHVTGFVSIEQGPAAGCGPNSPDYYEVTVEQSGVWKPCKLTVLVQSTDGNCMGSSPRKVQVQSPLVCAK